MNPRRGRATKLALAVIVLAPCLFAAVGPRITYTKVFKGSDPEFSAVTLDRSGQATYQDMPDDAQPLRFQLTEPQTAEIFKLADKLDHFSRPLESPRKVAGMGLKTLRYEDGADSHEVKFNYSSDGNAQALVDWFDRITDSEEAFYELQRAVQFDHLGVNQAVLRIQLTYDKKRLIAPRQFLPLLERVDKNEVFMHIARERAGTLAETFRHAPDGTQDATKDATQKESP